VRGEVPHSERGSAPLTSPPRAVGPWIPFTPLDETQLADDSAVALVDDPDGPILFAGDDVERPHPHLSQPDLGLYRRTLESLLALAPKVVVPGHGEPEGPELIRDTMAALAAREAAEAKGRAR